jgi:hypothetical protein
MVVAPNDQSLYNDDGWIHWANEYGIELVETITYTTLRGSRGKTKHPWLKIDSEDKKNYTATGEFRYMARTGLFIIFDEYHKATKRIILQLESSDTWLELGYSSFLMNTTKLLAIPSLIGLVPLWSKLAKSSGNIVESLCSVSLQVIRKSTILKFSG